MRPLAGSNDVHCTGNPDMVSPRKRFILVPACGLLFAGAAFSVRAPAALARAYTLAELIELANKGNQGLGASAQATAGIEAQLLEAERSWYPTGELMGLVTAAPEIRCQTDLPLPPGEDPKIWRQLHCDRTNVSEATLKL